MQNNDSALNIAWGECPRRTLSVNDSSGKKKATPLRKSVSDLTAEGSAPSEESAHTNCIIECKLRYCEAVAVPGVSDIPQLYGLEEDDAPSAPVAGGSFRNQRKADPTAKAVVSLNAPHKFLIVTHELCELFGYTTVESEICGRDLKTIFGPRTDYAAIETGMQSR